MCVYPCVQEWGEGEEERERGGVEAARQNNQPLQQSLKSYSRIEVFVLIIRGSNKSLITLCL